MDNLIPKVFPNSKFQIFYKVLGKILNQKKFVQLMGLEMMGEYRQEERDKPETGGKE